MDSGGVRISSLPVPKIYAASHGMCQVGGALWLEKVLEADGEARLKHESPLQNGAQREVIRHTFQ
jgi:hypothetical protein